MQLKGILLEIAFQIYVFVDEVLLEIGFQIYVFFDGRFSAIFQRMQHKRQ
jgi:hypothetical protein